MTFVIGKDEQGRFHLTDIYLVRGALDLECPQCGRKNEPILFWHEEDYIGEYGGCISRRYFYCCPNCKIHYTDWGPDADWKYPRYEIKKECKQNGDHESERLEFRKSVLKFLQSIADSKLEGEGVTASSSSR